MHKDFDSVAFLYIKLLGSFVILLLVPIGVYLTIEYIVSLSDGSLIGNSFSFRVFRIILIGILSMSIGSILWVQRLIKTHKSKKIISADIGSPDSPNENTIIPMTDFFKAAAIIGFVVVGIVLIIFGIYGF